VENGTLPLYIGSLMGYNKHFANFKEVHSPQEDIYESSVPDTEVKLSNLIYKLNETEYTASNFKNFHRVKEIFQNKIIGVAPWGSLICSKMTYDFTQAKLSDMETGSLRLESSWSTLFPLERALIRKIYPLRQIPDGLGMPVTGIVSLDTVGFHMRAKWTLSDPWSDCSK